MFSPQSPRTLNKTRIRCQIGREDKEFAKKKGKVGEGSPFCDHLLKQDKAG